MLCVQTEWIKLGRIDNRNLRIFGIYLGGKECSNKLILFIEVLSNYFQNILWSMCDLFFLCGFRFFSLCSLLFLSPLIKDMLVQLRLLDFFIFLKIKGRTIRWNRRGFGSASEPGILWKVFPLLLNNNVTKESNVQSEASNFFPHIVVKKVVLFIQTIRLNQFARVITSHFNITQVIELLGEGRLK